MSHADLHGLPLTCASAEAASAFNDTVRGYLKYRADTAQHMGRTLVADPGFALAHVLKGYFAMLSFKQANVPMARRRCHGQRGCDRHGEPPRAGARGGAGTLDRRRSRSDAGDVGGDPRRASDATSSPFACITSMRSGSAGPTSWRARSKRVMPRWAPELPGWGSLLACQCFAHEELGNYALAEPAGREAIAIDRGDLWAAHAVAHVWKCRGRRATASMARRAGAALEGRQQPCASSLVASRALPPTSGASSTRCWRFTTGASAISPRRWCRPSPTSTSTCRMRHPCCSGWSVRVSNVGERWIEIADKAEARVGDCLSAFTLPHWMMALAATRRLEAAGRMMEGMRAFAAARPGHAGAAGARLCAADLGSASSPARSGDHAGHAR